MFQFEMLMSVASVVLLAGCGNAPPEPSGAVGGGPQCTIPECFRAVVCVAECGGPVLQSGCCPCPEGSFDDITCPSGPATNQ
jgi:hypothetical protein